MAKPEQDSQLPLEEIPSYDGSSMAKRLAIASGAVLVAIVAGTWIAHEFVDHSDQPGEQIGVNSDQSAE